VAGSIVFDAFERALPVDKVISYGDSMSGSITMVGFGILAKSYAAPVMKEANDTEVGLRWSRALPNGIRHVCCASCGCFQTYQDKEVIRNQVGDVTSILTRSQKQRKWNFTVILIRPPLHTATSYHKPCVEPAGGHCSTIEELQQLLTAVADFERKYSYRVEVIFVGLTGTGQRMDPKYKSSKYNQRSEQLLEYSDALLSRLMKWNRDVAKASLSSWDPRTLWDATERDCYGKFTSHDGVHFLPGATPIIANVIAGWIEKLADFKATFSRTIP
jgi:hypothetical protein